MQYPKVVFNTDMSGVKLTMGQARKAATLRSRHKFPDIVIYETNDQYAGLFLELKRDGETIFLKDGTLSKKEHIQEQHRTLIELRKRGYCAEFAVGFEQAKAFIDSYLSEK